jgi:predicted O-methyltransferase YrrM
MQVARVLAWLRRYGYREHPALRACRLETLRDRADANIMTAPEVAGFVAFFLSAVGARRGVEVGVFTGYSSLAVALALPADGELVACELSAELAAVAKGHWQRGGVADKIRCRVGDARASLVQLLEEGGAGSFDFAYIDADKESYDSYYESCLALLRAGGFIIIDNTLWGGRVADSKDTEPSTQAIRRLNQKLFADERVDMIQSAMGDGTTFVRKR